MSGADRYDLIVVGTGFASTFFLRQILLSEKARDWRILVLERGKRYPHAWQVENRRNAELTYDDLYSRTGDLSKDWHLTVGFGGGSNCWGACTPRMMPSDFRLHSLYGVGRDWPVQYDELTPYYELAEEIMQVSGPADAPYPRAKPYPQPPHLFSEPEKIIKQRHPNHYFQQATARARVATTRRAACCANGVCTICPINAKFTIQNELDHLFVDPRITLKLEAPVDRMLMEGGEVRGVCYTEAGVEREARASLVALGANALFNPHILLKSGFDHPLLGRRLHEQGSISVVVDLDGMDNYQGSSFITGQGYMLYDGPHRREHGGVMMEHCNKPSRMIRLEKKRWLQTMTFKFVIEDLPQEASSVSVSSNGDPRPVAHFPGYTPYLHQAIPYIQREMPKILEGLPVQDLHWDTVLPPNEVHILGSTVMGTNPADSVVDPNLRYHGKRNLLVLGSSVFPTGAPANPTLTLSALALRAADRLLNSQA